MMRERLTITLKSDILQKVDSAIDGAKIRNRSHAIEYLIQKASGASISKALFLAGGGGVVMHSGAPEVPKAMLRVAGMPVLEHAIRRCRENGIIDIFISTGPEGAQIQEYFGDGAPFGVRITYLQQEKSNVGTAPSVLQAKHALNGEPFLLLYGDVLADIDLQDFISFHVSTGNVATMALTSAAKTSDWGVVNLHGANITEFAEKPLTGSMHSNVINAGMYICQPQVFDFIPPQSKKLEQDVFPLLAQAGKLSGYLFGGRWYDVGTRSAYNQAVREWVPSPNL